jgi:DeoR family transcriptional regulator, suf operon transcriptional repressor
MTHESAPAGFKGTRGDILVALKVSQPLTANELAERFGLTANAFRRHLKDLEAEGLVVYTREVRGVGQPVFAYRLTDAGERLFPSQYDVVLSQALETVREKFGSEAVVEIFRARWAAVAESAGPELALLPLPERIQKLAQLLSSMGYMAVAEENGHSTLREHHCTIRSLVDRFPEVCAAEERFIREVLGADVVRHAHIAKGANCCEYCITERTELATLGASPSGHGRSPDPS